MPIDGTSITKSYQFGMGKQLFAKLGKEGRGKPETIVPLKDMIQQVQSIENEWSMVDTIQPLNKVHIDFTGGGNGDMPIFQFRHKNQIGRQCKITRHALQQLSAYMGMKTSTGRSTTPFNLSEARCISDENMRKLETLAWSFQLDKIDHEVMFRSKVIDGIRTITSIQGVNYAPLRDSELLRKIDMKNGNITQFYIGSDYSQYSIVDGIPSMKDLTKMISILNSGNGKSGLEAYLAYYLQICTNGMMGWQNQSSYYQRHYGDREVITNQFAEAVDTMQETEDVGFVNLYNRSRQIELDSLWGTFMYRGGQFSKEEIEHAQMSMGATSLIASPINSIGHIIDGITLSAQAKSDPHSRMLVEKKATNFLVSIMNDYDNGRELVPEKFLESLV